LPRSPTVSGALQVGAASEQERRIRSGVGKTPEGVSQVTRSR
jgi:hypothetical protein